MAWAKTVYGDIEPDILEPSPDSESYLEIRDMPCDIPPMFKAEPAVLEAELLVQGRSISHAIPGRVVR